ncbi:MAG TPA: hypothetical protein ENN46_04060 [Candidatus Woesearchaeota archaeon]|nr:hypothetical protein [Candidatus Woesearchaeota archaeon]
MKEKQSQKQKFILIAFLALAIILIFLLFSPFGLGTRLSEISYNYLKDKCLALNQEGWMFHYEQKNIIEEKCVYPLTKEPAIRIVQVPKSLPDHIEGEQEYAICCIEGAPI